MNRRSSSSHCVAASTPGRRYDLDPFIDNGPVAEAFDENRIRLSRRKGGDATAAVGAPRGSGDGDAPHRFAARQGLAYEKVDMGLQETAGPELEDWKLGHELNLDQRLDDAGFGFDPEGKAAGRLLERDAVGNERVGRHATLAHRAEDLGEVLCVALRLPRSEVSRL